MGFVRRGGSTFAPRWQRIQEPTRRQGMWLLLAVSIVGITLRVLTLNSRSFWLDEATSVRQASWGLSQIIDRMSANVHPPLFHVLLHYWIRYFGRAELSVRSFALIFGLLAIPLAYWAGATIYDRRVGLFSAAIIALSPYFIWYAQEARMYSIMLVFGLLSVGTLYAAISRRRWFWWAAYAAATTLGMFTQFFFGFLVLTQAIYILVFLVIRRERDLGALGLRTARWSRPWRIFWDCPEATAWLACVIVVVLPQIWWLTKMLSHPEIAASVMPIVQPTGQGQATNFYQTLNYGNAVPRLGWQFNVIILATSQAIFGMHSDSVSRALSAMWPLAITLAFLLSGYARRLSARTWYVVYTGVFGFVIIALIGQWQPVYEVRYYMAVAAPLVILLARFLAELRGPTLRIVCAGLVLLALIMYADQSYNPDSIVKWDNREAVAAVNDNFRSGDVILLIPYYASSILEYYLPPRVYFAVRKIPLFNPDGSARNEPGQLFSDLRRQVGPAKRVWLVSSFEDTARVTLDRRNTVSWLERSGYSRTSELRLYRIRVALYEGNPQHKFFTGTVGEP